MRTNKFTSFMVALTLHALVLIYLSDTNPTSVEKNHSIPLYQSIGLNHFSVTPKTSFKNHRQQIRQGEILYPEMSAPSYQGQSITNQEGQRGLMSTSADERLDFIKMIPPPYPPLARERELEGKIKIRAYFNHEGIITKVDIIHSSGAALLDRSVQQSVMEWKVRKSEPGSFEQSFEFKLNP
ncbi:MAG: TonB family protein [Bacteriovorax sp.]|nr:TonB family protein [Bacteriovorax sp.]